MVTDLRGCVEALERRVWRVGWIVVAHTAAQTSDEESVW